MFSDEIAISVQNIGKCFQIYEHPRDRLKQFLLPKALRFFRLPERSYFREFWALRNVSFEIKRGETVGVIGRNGSGKSTLLQIICGTLNQSVGSIATKGRVAALLELGSGFNPEFSGRENVYMNAAVLGLSRSEIDARFDEIVAFSGIGDFIDQPVKTYSSGMLVRLAFSVAINVEPEILVVDEALSVGDELFQRKCFSKIESIRANGATILFVSHAGGQVVELCDRAILLDRGEQLAIGAPKQIVGRYQKLLYVPDEKRELVREQIRRECNSDFIVSDYSTKSLVTAEMDNNRVEEIPESFDAALVPSSTIAYESHGAQIVGPKILNSENQQVNNLIRGRKYRYVYDVIFDKSASNVRFGMLIKTTTGVELGGAASASSARNSIPFVEVGNQYRVEFHFLCSLNPGIYFLNAGVVGDVNESEVFLHRLIDVAMFRVLSEKDVCATGIVDFQCLAYVHSAQSSESGVVSDER